MMKFVDVVCDQCGHQIIDAFCEIPAYPECPNCYTKMSRLFLPSGVPTVIGDDIPGGLEIKHGICHPDDSPRKFYSHSEIRKAATAAGYVNRPERGVADKKVWDKLSSKNQINHPKRNY